MRYVLAAAFCSAFVIAAALVPLLRKVAPRLGLMAQPGGRRQHRAPMPLGGGIAILLACAVPVLGAGILSHAWQRDPSIFPVPQALQDYVRGAAGQLPLLLKVMAGGLAVAVLGLVDDFTRLRAPAKLAAQFVIAGAVALVPEVRITLFIHLAWVQVAVTAVWIVLLVNSFNLLDNMDGQSGLVGFLTGGVLLVLALQTAQYFIAGLLLALLGGMLGFLLYNLPPASIFMGDMGSMFIGYMLAVSTTLASFVTEREVVNPFFPVLVPLVIFAMPLYDVLSVVAIRLHTGRPLMEGDRSHVSHRLMRLGMSERTVLLTVGLMVLATSPGATIPYGSPTWRAFIPAIQAAAVILVVVLLELASAHRRKDETPA
jgi:UDP-GlcNAc:undecaprenyl-phosphate GlcNAc-1-phosphate transferase